MRWPGNSAWGGDKPIQGRVIGGSQRAEKKKEVDSLDENQMAKEQSRIEEGSMSN